MLDFLAASATRHRRADRAERHRGTDASAMVAGEASGDLLAGLLLDGLRARWPRAAGRAASAARRWPQRGFEAWWPQREAGGARLCRGAAPLPRDRRHPRAARRHGCWQERPDVFIGVDAPDFNLDLEAAPARPRASRRCTSSARRSGPGAPTASRRSARAADHVLCIFPFEPALLARHGIAATYVGHPLANVIPMEPDRAAARRRSACDADDAGGGDAARQPRAPRSQYLAPRVLSGRGPLMQRERPALRFVVPVVPGAARDDRALAAQRAGMARPSRCSTASRTPRWPPAT